MMRKADCHELKDAIDHLAVGRFEAITPEQMDVLEQHLNECTVCSAHLGAMAATTGDAPVESIEPLGVEEWARVWGGVEAAQARTRERRSSPWARGVPIWGAIAAALLLTVGIWQFGADRAYGAWELELARGTESQVSSMETFGDTMPMLLSAGEGDVTVIWVVENEEVWP